jgi:hypothetical protein
MPPRRSFPHFRIITALAVSGLAALSLHSQADDKIDFEKQILPIFDASCFKCHSAQAKKVKGEIRLDDVAEIRTKSRTENLIFPRKPDKSLLYQVISLPEGDEDLMPPPDEAKHLPAEQIALIRKWLEQGADFGHWKSATPKPKPVAVEAEEVNPADVAVTARRIDELIEAGLAKAKREPNPAVAEDLWCRRVHLDLIGRVPSYEEMQTFLQSRDPLKRAKLVDKLLVSNGHVSAMFNYWCDTLRARDELADNVNGRFYLHYLKESIRANKPYDVWVRELVSPNGSLAEAPAVGYYLRDFGNRFASVDNTAIVFLGTQIGCAQCHDHPYDEWSRRAYHQFAAWTSGVESKRGEEMSMNKLSEGDLNGVQEAVEKKAARRTTSQRRQLENAYAMQAIEALMNEMNRQRRVVDFSVNNGSDSKGQLPADYQYPDGKPNEKISPAVLFGDAPQQAGSRPADTFAAWLTSPQNPRFALTIANRMWTRLMGAPFSGSVDSIREPEDCLNPELARYLARVMVATKFDLRHFQRIVANTRTYARQAGLPASPGTPYDFPGPVLRRMSAEQVWDSMMTLAVPELDAKISFAPPSAGDSPQLASLEGPEEVMDMVKAKAKEAAAARLKEMRRHAKPKAQPFAPSPEFSLNGLMRASELPQPTPESHFLRVFGQSNREVADAGWRAGTVPQTLIMLNSTLFDVIVKKGTPLYETLKRESGDAGRLRAVYLSILGRVPTMEETRVISSALHGTGNIETIAHTLLGTRQFLFIQ